MKKMNLKPFICRNDGMRFNKLEEVREHLMKNQDHKVIYFPKQK